MAQNDQEIEAKFMVRSHAPIIRNLEVLGAELENPRVYESNLRFDTPAGDLTRQHRVLRLRQDIRATMTYKAPGQAGGDVLIRQEIEFEVGDFAAARRLLEALGYRVAAMYEKYRTTYRLSDSTVVLDEMPYGSFVEIEGRDPAGVRAVAAQLGLDWSDRSNVSYLALFDLLRQARDLPAGELSFTALQGMAVRPEELGLKYANVP